MQQARVVDHRGRLVTDKLDEGTPQLQREALACMERWGQEHGLAHPEVARAKPLVVPFWVPWGWCLACPELARGQ